MRPAADAKAQIMKRISFFNQESRSVSAVGIFLSVVLLAGEVRVEAAAVALPGEGEFAHLPVVRMPPTVVTATREVWEAARLPSATVRLSEDDLLEGQPRTLPDALAQTPGVLGQRTGPGQGSPYVRGFTGYRTLAMIDGVRLNNSVFRDGPNQYWGTIDTFGLHGVELMRGQGSVLYGSDAIGGTLNALTRRPVYPESGTQTGGRLASRVSSAERSVALRGEVSHAEAGSHGILAGVTWRDFGDLRSAGLGRQPRTGYGEYGGDVKLEWMPSEDALVTFLHQQFHLDDAWRTHSTVFGRSWRGTTVGNDLVRAFDQERYLTYLQAEGSGGGGVVDRWRAGVSQHRQAEDERRVRANGRVTDTGWRADQYGVFVQLGSDTEWGDWTYGFTYDHDRVRSARVDRDPATGSVTRRIQGPVADGSRYHLASVYAQNRIPVGERTQVWAGGSLNYARAEVGRAEDPVGGGLLSFDDSWIQPALALRLNHQLDEAAVWSLFGGASTGFRAPNLSDLSRLDGARSDEIETPSPGLDPEEFVSLEGGIRIDNGFVRAEVAAFHTWIDGMITGVRTGRTVEGLQEVSKFNATDGSLYGFEMGLEWDVVSQWTVFANAAWQEGRVKAPDSDGRGVTREPISRLLPFSGLVGLRYTAPEGHWWVEGDVRGAGSATRLSARDRTDTQRIPPGGTPSYVVSTLRAGYQPVDNLRLVAAIENLFDKDYRVHGSGINGPGRGVSLSVEWTF